MATRSRDWKEGRTLCDGKIRYRTQLSAERALAHIILHGSQRQVPRRAYLCERCGGYHLTSKEKLSG